MPRGHSLFIRAITWGWATTAPPAPTVAIGVWCPSACTSGVWCIAITLLRGSVRCAEPSRRLRLRAREAASGGDAEIHLGGTALESEDRHKPSGRRTVPQ